MPIHGSPIVVAPPCQSPNSPWTAAGRVGNAALSLKPGAEKLPWGSFGQIGNHILRVPWSFCGCRDDRVHHGQNKFTYIYILRLGPQHFMCPECAPQGKLMVTNWQSNAVNRKASAAAEIAPLPTRTASNCPQPSSSLRLRCV